MGVSASQKVVFKTIDVSNDKHLEQMFEEGTKEVQPTFPFPQIFAKGKILVGLDMIKDLLEVRAATFFINFLSRPSCELIGF